MLRRPFRARISDIVLMLVLVLLLTGCATSPSRPVEVSLDRTSLQVRMSNGETCIGPVRAVPAGPNRTTVSGDGRLQGCSAAYGYRVTGDTATNPVRFVLEEVFTAIGLPNVIAPAAEVEITAPDGRSWRFASPPEREDD
jgi:hypothetical protein